MVKFERVFPGVFLHHLFMHMNLFSPPLALHSLDRSKWCFRGFGKYSGTEIKIDGEEVLVMREDDIMGVFE